MSTDFRATQMQARKYIRFVYAQELRTRAMSAKRHHYRIIARARAPVIHSRERSRMAWSRAATRAKARAMQAQRDARVGTLVPALPIFCAYLRGSRRMSARTRSCSVNRSQAHQTTRRATRLPPLSVSNRNGAHAHRNRIFLHRHHHIFVAGTLQARTATLETRCESSDSQE
jgi:hypothetical protein